MVINQRVALRHILKEMLKPLGLFRKLLLSVFGLVFAFSANATDFFSQHLNTENLSFFTDSQDKLTEFHFSVSGGQEHPILPVEGQKKNLLDSEEEQKEDTRNQNIAHAYHHLTWTARKWEAQAKNKWETLGRGQSVKIPLYILFHAWRSDFTLD
jgi:hypothetical protein